MTDSMDLLRGAKAIAQEIYGKGDRASQRRLYHEQSAWPVFKLKDTGVLYALRSRLREHVEMKLREKEARMMAAATEKSTPKAKLHAPRR